MIVASLRYADIRVGSIYEFERTITPEDVLKFAELTGDYNPLHIDHKFGVQSQFGKNVVHGMFAASLFSTLVGMYCPGKHCLYMSQTLQFRKPVFYGDNIIVRGTVVEKSDGIHMVTFKTEILRDNEILISGEAKACVV